MVSAGEGTESKRSRDGRERMIGEGGGEGERERSELKKCLDHLSYSSVVSFDFFWPNTSTFIQNYFHCLILLSFTLPNTQ